MSKRNLLLTISTLLLMVNNIESQITVRLSEDSIDNIIEEVSDNLSNNDYLIEKANKLDNFENLKNIEQYFIFISISLIVLNVIGFIKCLIELNMKKKL